MARVTVGLFMLLQIHISHQYFANLCFNRVRTLDCSLQGTAFINGTLKVQSVTLLLSSDENRLRTNNNGQNCGNVEIECQTTVRETKRDEFDSSLLAVNDYIKNACDGEVSCDIVIPDWSAVDGTSSDCAKRFNTQKFHLRGVYLDVECNLPTQPPTTDAATANTTADGSTTNTNTAGSTSRVKNSTDISTTGVNTAENTISTSKGSTKRNLTTDRKATTRKSSFPPELRPARKSINRRGDNSASRCFPHHIGAVALLVSALLL